MVESKGEEYGIKSIPVNKATYVGLGIMQILRKKNVRGNSHKWGGCNLIK